MNKKLHRVVFNAARCMRVVVQETAKSAGKATGATSAGVGIALTALLGSAAQGQIIGAPNVPGNQRPTVLTAPNGVPLVNIQTPSAAGVSRNVYSRFDIEQRGAILNNSRKNVETQLGGWVQGNPYLATGPARVILNEVNSGTPSQLRGFVEVGGQRAEVVIANPAGIVVDGGGFINASRVTLTTGVPQLNSLGGLDGFRVNGGNISIDGKGLDLSQTDYAAIYARAMQVNAGIWANDLTVATGANQISAEHGEIIPIAGSGSSPAFALDVAALGGMFANKIKLIGTEAGLGVRNAGNIGAGSGGLVVTAAGRLENTGTLEGQRIEIASATDIDNRGGTIRQSGTAGLTLTAPILSNTQGGVVGAEPLSAGTGDGAGSADGSTNSGGGAGVPSEANEGGSPSETGGASPSQPYVPPSPGSITAPGTILNDGGRIYAGGPITLQTPQVNNAGGVLNVDTMAVTGPVFANAGGSINVRSGFNANVGSFDNSAGGKLSAGRVDIAATGDLNNQDGTIESGGDATFSVGGTVNNTRGAISAAGALTAEITGAVQNASGSLMANQAVSIRGQSLDNTLGSVASAAAGTSLAIANALVNSGNIGAATDLSIQAGSLNNAGSLRGANDSSVVVAGQLVNDGSITAGRNTIVSAASLQGGRSGVLGAGVQNDGSLGAAGDLNVSTTGALVAQGTNVAAGNATLQGASVDLSASQTSGANIAITATQGDVTTSGATVATAGTLSVTADAQAGQTLVNEDGTLNAGQLDLRASDIANTNGAEIVQTGTGATTLAVSGKLDNSGGRIASNGQDLTLQGSTIANTGGRIEHAGTGALNIQANSLDGANGQIISNGALVAAVTGHFNQDGGTTTAKQVTIDAGSLGNRGGKIIQTGPDATRIAVVGMLDNSNGATIASNGATAITAGSVNNQAGSLRAAGTSDLSISTSGLLDNSAQGDIGAGGNLALATGSLVNDSGRVTAVSDLTASIIGAASNVDGTLAANGDTTISADNLDSTRGGVAAVNGDLRVTTAGTTVNAGGTMQAGGNVALANGGLDNTAGKVFGNALDIDTRGNALSNVQGTLAAATTVALNSGALANDAGLIQSGGAMTANTNGQGLSNTNAAGYAGGQGGIASGGRLDLNAGSVNNAAGYIGSRDALTASTGAFSNVNGGAVSSQSRIAIDTHGATFDNSGGQTQAIGDLTLSAGDIANTAGLIRSVATTTLSAGTITNLNTHDTDQGIEGQNIAITVGNLDNTSGAIRSDVNTTITSGGNLDNTSGLISAGDTLRIADPNAANPAAKTLSVTDTNGTLVANQSLTLDAANFSGDGTIVSGKDLSIALVQDIVNNGEVSANGDLSYTTLGTLTNNGKLLAGGTLTAGGNAVENTANAEMSGADTVIKAGTLNNRGLIDSHGQTRIDAGTVNNIGTGRIYGDAVAIGAGTLNNDAETIAGVTSAATIAARSSLDIGADTINNRDGSLIFSAGDMYIGGALDAAGQAIGRGSVLNNLSASIESLGNMSIATGTVNNFDTHLVIGQSQETGPLINTVIPTGGFEAPRSRFILDPDDRYTWYINDDGTLTPLGRGWIEKYRAATTTTDYVVDSAPSRLVAGGNMSIDGLLRNHDSKVIAGGSFTSTQPVDNYQSPAQKVTRVEGWDVSISGFDTSGNSDYSDGPPYLPPHLIEQRIDSIKLAGFEFEENLNATQGYDPGAASNVNGPGSSAGQAGGVSGGSGSGAVIEVASAVKGSASAGGSGAGAAGATDADGTAGSTRDVPMVVRTSAPDTRVPSASLFRTQAGGNYLIETDPRFANYRNWLSSDYLFNAMGFDPNSVQKRLGDGFYEQKLIREQVAELTGYRYLDGFSNDEEQYVALMNAGVTFAQTYHLTPGIALTAEQMAQLTSDIVWLVEQTVTLPDGSTQRVLAPQVYVRVQPGDIDGSGALLSADRTIIKGAPGAGDLVNSGTIAGRSLVSITADNINNLGGRISGGNVALDARADINVIGGTVDARDSLALTAGNDINVRTTTNSTQSSHGSTTHIDRVAGLYVTNPGGSLITSAGRDVNLIAAEVVSAGSVGVGAGRNVNLGTVTESSNSAVVFNARNGYSESQSLDIGSAIQGTGDVRLAAGNDLNIKASSVASVEGSLVASAGRDINIEAGQASESSTSYSHAESKKLLSRSSATDFDSSSTTDVISSSLSGNSVALVAGNDINAQAAQLRSDKDMSLVAGRDISLTTADQVTQDSHYSERTKKATGLGMLTGVSLGAGDVGAKFVAGSSSTSISSTTSTQAVGTTVSAGSLQTVSGRDTALQGATVVADNDITMLAGRNLTIESAQNTTTHSSFDANSKSGMIGTRTNPSLGNVKSAEAVSGSGVSQASSQVASLQGNVTLVAGETYRQTASSVMAAGQAGPLVGGDVNILAKNVVINEAFNTEQSFAVSHNSSTVVGGSASVGGISTDSLRNARNTAKAMGDTGDSRMQALGAVNLAVAGSQAVDTAQALASGGGVGFKVSVNVSRNKSESSSITNASEAVGSSIVGANNVNIVAIGGGAASNIHAVGSTIAAGNNVNLAADNAITLEASKNTYDKVGQNSSSGASVGVGFAGGSQNGFTIELGVSQGRGNENGSDVSYNNTHVSGGKAVNIASGGDLNIKGGVIDGERVAAVVGGNLNIESLQDTSRQVSKQSNSGANVSLCIPPICYGVSTVGGNAASAKANGDFASVNEQSGIKAGEGGFNVNVTGNTDLKGGVIESTQAATDAGNNSFKSGSLSISDIVNRSTSEGSSYAVSGNVGFAAGDQSGASSAADKRVADGAQASGRPGGSAGVGSSDSSQGSVTKSGISGIAGDESVRTGDNSSAGTLVKDWNTNSIIKDVQAQAQITQEFNKNAATAVGDYADKQQREAAKRSDEAEAAKWAEGGEYRVAAHVAAASLGGGVAGALGAGASAALMPGVGRAIDDMDLSPAVKQAVSAAVAAGIGATVGGAAGAAGGYNTDINNRQLHPTETTLIKENATRFAKKLYGTDNPTQAQIEAATSALVNTAQNIVDNNLDSNVPFSQDAFDFLQTLKVEYQQSTGSVQIPGSGGQTVFYANVEEKNFAALNAGLGDPSVTGLIIRTPINPTPSQVVDKTRDRLTGLPLDESGRYSVQIQVGNRTYEPKYFPCAVASCIGNNLDLSDPSTQSYVKAIDKKIMDDINYGATVTTLVTPVGVAGTIAGIIGPVTSLASGAIDGNFNSSAIKETLQLAATQYMTRVYGLSEAVANRVAATVDLAGGWQAFVDRARGATTSDKK